MASPRECLKFCLLVNARSFLVAHNHPSGALEPSRADVEVTKQLVSAGEAIGIPLRDHIIVGHAGLYTSLAERELL